MATLTLVVPLSILILPGIHRGWKLDGLTATDPARRAGSLGYLLAHDDDDRVIRGAIDRLATTDDTAFLDLVDALDRAGVWRHQDVGDTAWLRWIDAIASDPADQARAAAAGLLADLPRLAADPRVLSRIQALAHDPNPDVRYNALTAAAELALPAGDRRTDYEAMIAGMASDPQPAIATDAWILRGLLDPVHGLVANWRDAQPPVAAAMLWATLHTHPAAVAPAVEAMLDESLPADLRGMAAYALHASPPPTTEQMFVFILGAGPRVVTAVNEPLYWRALLAAPMTPRLRPLIAAFHPPPGSSPPTTERATAPPPETPRKLSPARANGRLETLELAALYRTPTPGSSPGSSPRSSPESSTENPPGSFPLRDRPESFPTPPAAFSIAENSDSEALEQIAELAEAEGRPGRHDETIRPHTPPLIRLVLVERGAGESPEVLAPCFASESSTLRDRACLAAVDRFNPEQLDPVIADLLKSFEPNEKMAGCVLAGLTGRQPDLLRKRWEIEHTAQVREAARLGLWMAGDEHAMTLGNATALLGRSDIDIRSTVLLAMLHVGQRQPQAAQAALDFLLNPRGQPTVNLIELFDTLRWWPVLDACLPNLLPPPPPPFWVWADPQLQAFQIQVLQNWYLVHRSHLSIP